MKKFIGMLILSLALTLWPFGWATAAHTSFGFDLPHEVAEQIAQWHFDAFNLKLTETPGCDVVVTASLRTDNGAIIGYVIHAAIVETEKERLVAIELFDVRGKKVFGWINKDDYNTLKECHTANKVGI